MPVMQFIGAVVGASAIVVFASLLWPRITGVPRPESLNKVRETVLQTEAGQNLANTLGVSDEGSVEPVSLPSLAAGAAQSVIQSVVTTTQNTVTAKVLESLSQQFDQLPQDQQAKFRQMICVPTE